MNFKELPVKDISPNKEWVRFQEDTDQAKKETVELAASIKAVGLLQPIVVTKDNGGYTVVAGNRRFKAVQYLKWDTVPANIVGEGNFWIAFTENIQRKDLTDIERGFWLIKAIKEAGAEAGKEKLTTKELLAHFSTKLGKSPRTLADYMSLARETSPKQMEAFEKGEITATDLIKIQREERKKKGKRKGKGAPGGKRTIKTETVVKQTSKRFVSISKDLSGKLENVQKLSEEFSHNLPFIKAFDLLYKQMEKIAETFKDVKRR